MENKLVERTGLVPATDCCEEISLSLASCWVICGGLPARLLRECPFFTREESADHVLGGAVHLVEKDRAEGQSTADFALPGPCATPAGAMALDRPRLTILRSV